MRMKDVEINDFWLELAHGTRKSAGSGMVLKDN